MERRTKALSIDTVQVLHPLDTENVPSRKCGSAMLVATWHDSGDILTLPSPKLAEKAVSNTTKPKQISLSGDKQLRRYVQVQPDIS